MYSDTFRNVERYTVLYLHFYRFNNFVYGIKEEATKTLEWHESMARSESLKAAGIRRQQKAKSRKQKQESTEHET